ncbi:hypothetical protein HrrHc1_215 [Halorubrum phage Hardycor1]|nr:hypothetical protein HrrHc1_215 [Halorubrum phage Hardycor1]
MNETHYETAFGGVHGAASGSVPGWYRAAHDAARGNSVEFPHLAEVLGTLTDEYGATTTDAYYYDDERDEYVEIPERAAVVNPAWTGDGLSNTPRGSAAWTTASDSYEPINAKDAYGPLVDVAHDEGYEDVFGAVETYRVGGEVVVEVLFDDLRFEDPESGTEWVLGFETGYDHYRRSSVWATLLAYDTSTGASLRGLSERYTRSHRGENASDEISEWFRGMIGRVERLDETLAQVVAEAREYEVPMSELPVTVAEFYEAQGFPASYASAAADRLRNHRTPSAFDLYLAIAETVTTEFEGKTGGDALRRHAGRANDLLFSPPSAEREALVAERERLADDDQTRLPNGDGEVEPAAEQLDDRIDSLDDGVEAFESMRERFRTMLDELDEQDEDGDEVAA